MYIFAIVLSVLYLLWRVLFTIPWHTHIGVLIFALALVISEIVSNLTAYVLIILRLMEDRHRQTITIPEYDLSQPLPDVDILIVTHNEDVALLKKNG
jgi:cellulose synthase (UDP-forming)